ncbi:MFS transporter [Prosthecomicrobium pneumaticum]|uniref:MFS family permease n=1 Tax=Prosthecomicrobium pneumaticum TaxID=81895 RepID=A0A7W9CW61_9HYPH|nr:MFS transporter [Prosthecomicrobium pneumaticum]MBB5752671.1 MFS family permease [Prosthecomicrobium pneumaticum]
MSHSAEIEAEPCRNGSLVAPLASVAAVGLGFSIAMPLLSLTLEARGISNTWIGINTAAWGLASMAITPFVPRLAAFIGTSRLLALSIATMAAALPLFWLAENFWLWFPLRFLAGAALTVTFVLSEFWISTVAPPARRGLVMGLYATLLSLGFACGPLVLRLTGLNGLPPFGAGAIVLALAVIPILAGGNGAPRLSGHARGGMGRFLFLAPVATGAALLFGMIESGAFALLPLYGQAVGFDRDTVILFAIAVTIGNIVMQLPIGLLSDRIDRRALLLGIAVCGLVGSAVTPLVAHGFWPFMILLGLWGGSVGALYTVGLAHLGSRFSGADLATANAAFVFCYSAGALGGPAVIGAAMDVWRPHGFAVALGAFFLAYIVLVFIRLTTRAAQNG